MTSPLSGIKRLGNESTLLKEEENAKSTSEEIGTVTSKDEVTKDDDPVVTSPTKGAEEASANVSKFAGRFGEMQIADVGVIMDMITSSIGRLESKIEQTGEVQEERQNERHRELVHNVKEQARELEKTVKMQQEEMKMIRIKQEEMEDRQVKQDAKIEVLSAKVEMLIGGGALTDESEDEDEKRKRGKMAEKVKEVREGESETGEACESQPEQISNNINQKQQTERGEKDRLGPTQELPARPTEKERREAEAEGYSIVDIPTMGTGQVGLRATKDLPAGVLLAQTKLLPWTKHSVPSCAFLDMKGMRKDGGGPGNVKFANHSCNPNCAMQVVPTSSGGAVWLVTGGRHIKPGEDLTVDYRWTSDQGEKRDECKCGVEQCRGYIQRNADSISSSTSSASDMGARLAELNERAEREGYESIGAEESMSESSSQSSSTGASFRPEAAGQHESESVRSVSLSIPSSAPSLSNREKRKRQLAKLREKQKRKRKEKRRSQQREREAQRGEMVSSESTGVVIQRDRESRQRLADWKQSEAERLRRKREQGESVRSSDEEKPPAPAIGRRLTGVNPTRGAGRRGTANAGVLLTPAQKSRIMSTGRVEPEVAAAVAAAQPQPVFMDMKALPKWGKAFGHTNAVEYVEAFHTLMVPMTGQEDPTTQHVHAFGACMQHSEQGKNWFRGFRPKLAELAEEDRWNEMVLSFLRRFQVKKEPSDVMSEFSHVKQRKDETVEEFRERMNELEAEVRAQYQNISASAVVPGLMKEDILRYFKNGLRQELAMGIAGAGNNTLDKAFSAAKEVEKMLGKREVPVTRPVILGEAMPAGAGVSKKAGQKPEPKVEPQQSSSLQAQPQPPQQPLSQLEQLQQQQRQQQEQQERISQMLQQQGQQLQLIAQQQQAHVMAFQQPPQQPQQQEQQPRQPKSGRGGSSPRVRTCHRCGSESHLVRDCPHPRVQQQPQGAQMQPQNSGGGQPQRCFRCGKEGHYTNTCTVDPNTLTCTRCGGKRHVAIVCQKQMGAGSSSGAGDAGHQQAADATGPQRD